MPLLAHKKAVEFRFLIALVLDFARYDGFVLDLGIILILSKAAVKLYPHLSDYHKFLPIKIAGYPQC